MGSLFTKIKNAIEYRIDSVISDPEAEKYSKRKAKQDAHDEKVAENKQMRTEQQTTARNKAKQREKEDAEIARNRVQTLIDQKNQQEIEFEKPQ